MVQVAGIVVASAVGFATFIVVARALGPSIYGDIAAANVYLYIPTVLAEVGLSILVVREISADEDSTEAVIGGSLPLRALIGIVTVTTAVLVALLLPFGHRTKIAIVAGSPGAFFTIMTLSVQPVLQARLKMHWAVAANVAGRVTTLALTIIALAAGFGYVAVMTATVLGLGITLALSVVFVRQFIRIRLRLDFALWRRLIGPALFLAVAVGASDLTGRADTILISLIRSSRDVGLYGAAYKFLDVFTLLASAIGISLFPVFSRLLVHDSARARVALQKSLDVVLGVSLPIVALTVFLAPQLIRYSAGADFRGSVPVLQLLAPSLFVIFLQTPLIRYAIAAGAYRVLAGIMLSMLLVNIALNLLLIPTYGIRAAAIVNVATELLGLALQLLFFARKLAFRPSLSYVPAVAIATGALALSFVLLGSIPIAAAAAGTILYAAVLLALPGAVRELAAGIVLTATARSEPT
jgi:O-antigen/teichoic acid export membrane protein